MGRTDPVQPLDPYVAQTVADLNDDDREFFEERAAIFEYEAGLHRRVAERRALVAVRARSQPAGSLTPDTAP